jgi:alpha-D-xyloside xylohydrolase
MEWTTQKPADPIELRIYAGKSGDFTFYEDQNDGYQYEKGAHATIALHWDDATRTLTLASREGTFPCMLPQHTIRVILVSPNHGVGIDETPTADKTVTYTGDKQAVSFYSETRVGVSRNHCAIADATIRERRTCTKLTGPQELWFRSDME